METFALIALNWFYYQTWLVVMFYGYGLARDNRTATVVYVFLAYIAVAWHPLIDELFTWLKQ